MPNAKTTQKRKGEHVDVVLRKDVQYDFKSGLDSVRFEHCALPDFDISATKVSREFLGRKLALPFIVAAITGGYSEAKKINSELALACEEKGCAFGLGSQRAMIEDPSLASTYCVKKEAPGVFLCGNIGAYQLAQYHKAGQLSKVESAIEKVEADALCVHLNALQECTQPEGDRNWSGTTAAIKAACEKISVPIIAKETGAGISGKVAVELERLGVKAIDVSGAGGTSWSAVELERTKDRKDSLPEFRNWGLPTKDALEQCSKATHLPLIATGGIRSGLDVAKAIRLGATLGGAAYPFLMAQQDGGQRAAALEISRWERGLRTALFLCGCKNLEELAGARLLTQ